MYWIQLEAQSWGSPNSANKEPSLIRIRNTDIEVDGTFALNTFFIRTKSGLTAIIKGDYRKFVLETSNLECTMHYGGTIDFRKKI